LLSIFLNINVLATQRTQAITFDSTPPSGVVVGSPGYQPQATGGASGQPVVFSVDGATTNNACSVSGNTVHFDHAGSCVIGADQAATSVYAAAPHVTQTVDVGKASQTLVFNSSAPPDARVGGSYVPDISGGGSTSPIALSVASATTNAACSVTGNTVNFDHAGTCAVAADQAGDADHQDATQVTQQFGVTKSAQTVTFTSTPPVFALVGETYVAKADGGASGNLSSSAWTRRRRHPSAPSPAPRSRSSSPGRA
jgi:hypothetical protein